PKAITNRIDNRQDQILQTEQVQFPKRASARAPKAITNNGQRNAELTIDKIKYCKPNKFSSQSARSESNHKQRPTECRTDNRQDQILQTEQVQFPKRASARAPKAITNNGQRNAELTIDKIKYCKPNKFSSQSARPRALRKQSQTEL